MIRPSPRCVFLFAIGLPVALVPTLTAGAAWPFWLVALVVCGGLVAVDGFRMLPARGLRLEVEVPPRIYIGDEAPLRVRLGTGRWRTPVVVDLRIDLDARLRLTGEARVELHGEPADVAIPLRPSWRGQFTVAAIWARWTSPWGLLVQTRRTEVGSTVTVVPNVKAVRETAIRFFSNREFLSGLKVERYRGDGSEFASLREFMPGHDHRAIDWKASARHRKLMCREFQAERNHQVVLAIDTGYLMREPLDGIPRLDHAINAGLVLAYVCLKGGDRVGLFSFDERVGVYAEPQGGVHAIHRLQQQAAELAYTTAETNFTLALASLSTRLRRRSLIVLVTDFADSITAELMINNVQLLAHRHLIVFVTMADPMLKRLRSTRPDSVEDLQRSVVVDGLIREREVVHRRLARHGVQCIDTAPGHLGVDLVNRYLDLRQRERV